LFLNIYYPVPKIIALKNTFEQKQKQNLSQLTYIPVAPLIEQDVHKTNLSYSLIAMMVQVTPSNRRDGPTTAINFLNADNEWL
jgi:hypothetical protein